MPAPLLQDLLVVVAVAAAMTLLFHRLRQPVVLGYLLAGILIGPHTPPFSLVTDKARIQDLAELGLVFLMFALGLEFNLRKLRQHGTRAIAMAAIEVTSMIALGYGAGRALGWDVSDSLFLGAIIASTSTTILAKVLQEMGLIRQEFAQAALAVTILEDILVLLFAVFLESTTQGVASAGLVLTTLVQVVVFVLMVVSLGLVSIPRLIDWVHRQDVDELMVVAVVGIAFVGAFLANALGFSLALGAFLAGTLVSESKAALRVTTRINPIRDLFASAFFVAVGMLLDPRLIWRHLDLVLLVSAIALGGKFASNLVAAWLVGHDGRTSARIGIAMAQMGEWSLIVAALGVTLGVT
ncbi:MAG TPA: cation:proton antiporter, partial [Candidatus Thermoplasmatota archaeon]|nr:cation:proton antiporter [Candidatus Thermoplasmatota archaeon]